MIDVTGSVTRRGMTVTAVIWALFSAAGVAHSDSLPFPGRGYASVGDPVEQGQVLDLTVKERPGNPHPTAVDVSSPALVGGTVLGDTGRAWVGSGRVKKSVKPGIYEVKFILRHKDADCMAEADRGYACDYPPIELRQMLKIASPQRGPALGSGIAIGVASGASVTALSVAVVLFWRRRAAGRSL